MSLVRYHLFLILAGLAALTLATDRARRLGLAAAVVGTLGLASLEAVTLRGRSPPPLPVSFLAVASGHLLLTCAVLLGALWVDRAGPAAPAAPRAGLLPIALVAGTAVAGLAVAGPLARSGGWLFSLAAALGLALVAILAVRAGGRLRLADLVMRLDRVLSTQPGPIPAARGVRTGWIVVQSALTTVALLAVQLDLVLGAIGAAVVAGTLIEREEGVRSRVPPGTMIPVVPLVLAWWLLVQVAGPVPHWIDALREAPYSRSFQLLTTLLLAAAAWPLLGLWPLRRIRLGPASPVAGAVLMGRVASPLLGEGVSHWQPILFPLVVWSVWDGVSWRRGSALLIGLGTIGASSLADHVLWPALGLVGAGALCRVLEESPSARPEIGRGARRFAWLIPLALLPAVLQAGLQAQTTYTVAAGWAAVIGVLRAEG
jgi:hypothetical protein